ncbi:hypothetical protein [Paenibacillus spongiae]|uniref:Uncharacterized protein n=1 Tax=Paenibacillus spongiae TaxID=2909671 RepID=A0ABY5S620_9BACL|nr:hypothetical protein [Paenibacillus spongiae]UVI29030.1 hypothetical protein L1F29_26885 [Paenibacillus spongiae]
MRKELLMFGLKDELTRSVPDVWDDIHKRIAHHTAAALLQELDGIPSPEGRLFGEMREQAKQTILGRGA